MHRSLNLPIGQEQNLGLGGGHGYQCQGTHLVIVSDQLSLRKRICLTSQEFTDQTDLAQVLILVVCSRRVALTSTILEFGPCLEWTCKHGGEE